MVSSTGTVNLSGRVSHIQVDGKMSQGSLLPNAADFRPDVESLGPGSSVLSGSDMIAAEVEQVIDLIVGGEEALRLAGRERFPCFPAGNRERLARRSDCGATGTRCRVWPPR